MRVKVCGITHVEDAQRAVDLGASAIGFVLWPASPRYVEPDRVRSIVRTLPAFVTTVGVFVDQPQEDVKGITKHIGLGAVQLHGNESAEYCATIGRQVIRALALTDTTDPADLIGWPATVTVMLDAHDPEKHGGTGRPVNWTLAARVAAARPIILAGGLRPENVGVAIETVRPYAIDVSSGVESSPGIKDQDRMRAFFRAVEAVRKSSY